MELPALKIGDVITKIPIIQGGMGVGISLSGLSSAVANEGGFGVIATAMIGMGEPDIASHPKEADMRVLRREIRRAKQMTDGILGVNIMVALTNYAYHVTTSIEEDIDVIFAGAGLPLDLPKYLKQAGHPKLVPIVSSGRAATIICKRWWTKFKYLPDAFVVEGPLAGGHLGLKPKHLNDPHFALEYLVSEVLEAVRPFEQYRQTPIPIIAAGGIYTGGDIYKFLKLGAAGVQMATRFVTTHECDADIAFKQAYINAKEEDIIIIDSPVGLPGRAIRNRFLEDVNRGKKIPFSCPYHCITNCNYTRAPYCIALALLNAKKGKLTHGFVFTGQNAYKNKHIISVKKLISCLTEEFHMYQNNEVL